MKEAVLIFPHQLFEEHPALDSERVVYLTEEFLFFRQQISQSETGTSPLFNEILSGLS